MGVCHLHDRGLYGEKPYISLQKTYGEVICADNLLQKYAQKVEDFLNVLNEKKNDPSDPIWKLE